ncbi:MAG: NADH-quinone oxidoreductase subunit B [Candidatus Eisenbacteria bacterium]|nr:NADH-quinone oxidoreductase subunit B [Candidatus Eisenbacteria bacterium]
MTESNRIEPDALRNIGQCPAGGEGSPLVVTTTVDDLVNWARSSSIWYMLFATACCGIELMQTGGPRTDLDRFGFVFRSSPRQSDVLIVAGTITYKMADRVRLLYAQMSEPKYVIAMGSCTNCGGLFQRSYSVIPGVDTIVPVDIYLPGCPPRPEALNEALLRLQDLMRRDHWADRLGKDPKQTGGTRKGPGGASSPSANEPRETPSA